MKSINSKDVKKESTKSPSNNQLEEDGGDSPLNRLLETLRALVVQDPYRGQVRIQPLAVLQAYQMARLAEIVSPASSRSRQGTQHQYKSALNTLRSIDPSHDEETPNPNPFHGFMEFDCSNSKSNFYKYKAALQAHAVELLLEYGEALMIQFWEDAFVQGLDGDQRALTAETDRRIRMLHRAFNVDRTDDLSRQKSFKKDMQKKATLLRQRPLLFQEAISAAAYLTAFPPLLRERTEHILTRKNSGKSNLRDLHIANRGLTVFDIADGFDPEEEWSLPAFGEAVRGKRDFSKRQLIAELNRLDKRLKDDLDWRERFFHYLDATSKRGREDKKKQTAILTLTGCRPSELSRGVRIYLEEIDGHRDPEKPVFGLVFKILGSKCTVLAQEEEIAIVDKMNAAEKRFQNGVYGHPAHRSNQERGHDWRILRVVSDAPEAAFLAKDIMERGKPVIGDVDRDPSLLSAERLAIRELISGRLAHWTTVFPQATEQAFSEVGEADVLPEDLINKQAHNIGAWISYHAGKLQVRSC